MSRIKQTNGSVIIAALILTLVLGTLVGVYLNTVVQEEEYSYRSRMAFQAVNIAEAGIDYAIYSFITGDWSDWTSGDNGYYRTSFSEITTPPDLDTSEISGFTGLGTNENYNVRVYAQKGDPGAEDQDDLPMVLAEGRVTLSNGISVSRQIMVRLQYGTSDDPTDGGYWGNGILAKNDLTFNGNSQAVDSFHSGHPNGMSGVGNIYDQQVLMAGTTILGHSFAGSNGSVASMSVSASDINLGNAAIYGSVATGDQEDSTDPTDMVGPNGAIYTDQTQMEGDDSFDGSIDNDYLSYDFFAELPDVPQPEVTGEELTTYSDNTLVGNTDSTTPYAYTEYRLGTVNLTGTSELLVRGRVKLIIDGDLKTSGQAKIVLDPDPSIETKLDIYVSGDVNLSGGGIINEGTPPSLRLFNTGFDTDIKIAGNGAFSGAVYAPNSDLVLDGGGSTGEFFGAVVAQSVTLNGNYAFHYDEALSIQPDPEQDPDDETFIPEVHSWVELTDATEIRNMATILNDGI